MDPIIAKLERQLADKEYAISSLEDRMTTYDNEIAIIHAETSQNDEEMRQLQKQQKANDKNPHNINAEDAFDTMIRLESTIKIIEKRNAVLEKDNAARDKLYRDTGKLLQKLHDEEEKLIAATGYHPDQSKETSQTDYLREQSSRAGALEENIKKEINAANVVIKKKRDLIVDLTKKIEDQKGAENVLFKIYNDVRVADREAQEAARNLESLKAEYGKVESSLIAATDSGREVAVKSLQGDREFLKEEIRKHKADKARQDKVIAAQLSRTKFLQERLDVVMAAVRDMRLEKDLDSQVSRDLVVTSSGANAEDPDRILPANEMIPVEIYELLHRDYEAMRSIADRKAILVTEKTCTTDAQIATIMMYQAQMEMTTKMQDSTRLNNKLEQHEAVIEVTRLVEEFRRELAKLVNENARLKAVLHDQNLQKRDRGTVGDY